MHPLANGKARESDSASLRQRVIGSRGHDELLDPERTDATVPPRGAWPDRDIGCTPRHRLLEQACMAVFLKADDRARVRGPPPAKRVRQDAERDGDDRGKLQLSGLEPCNLARNAPGALRVSERGLCSRDERAAGGRQPDSPR